MPYLFSRGWRRGAAVLAVLVTLISNTRGVDAFSILAHESASSAICC